MIDTLAQATALGFSEWVQHQITVGNLASIGSVLVAFGYQMRRLQDIERDIAAMRDAQRASMADVAATYTRRDVLSETLCSINARLGNIEADLRDVKHSTRQGAAG
jgi:anti-sigma-K factor RskA